MASPTERLPRSETLRRSADYLRCYRQGRRHHGALLTLHQISNALETPRLGITASRKVGKAVVRNRTKRRIREIYRRWPGRPTLPARDLVVHLKPTVRDAPFAALEAELLRLLAQVVRWS